MRGDGMKTTWFKGVREIGTLKGKNGGFTVKQTVERIHTPKLGRGV